jgi:hypothetical protein
MLTPPGSLNGSTGTLEGLAAALNQAGAQGLVIQLMLPVPQLFSCAEAPIIPKLAA